jgi:predicted naringenin-chalcone synthase
VEQAAQTSYPRSATSYFLLKAGLATGTSGPCTAMAFGPGLTVEMALLHGICNAP